MPINKKTGKVIKPKSAMQKLKAAMTRRHNKAFGIKRKKKK